MRYPFWNLKYPKMTLKASEKNIVGRFVNALHSAVALISYRGIEFWDIADKYQKIAEQEREDAFVTGYLNGLNHEMNNRNSQYKYTIDDIRKTYNIIYHDDKRKTKPCKIGIIGAYTSLSEDE
jgi:hypothetical protein